MSRGLVARRERRKFMRRFLVRGTAAYDRARDGWGTYEWASKLQRNRRRAKLAHESRRINQRRARRG